MKLSEYPIFSGFVFYDDRCSNQWFEIKAKGMEIICFYIINNINFTTLYDYFISTLRNQMYTFISLYEMMIVSNIDEIK